MGGIRKPKHVFEMFINLKHVIYDIWTEILCKTCFGHNSTQNERTSTMFNGFCTELCIHCDSAIKTKFTARFKQIDILGFATIAFRKKKLTRLTKHKKIKIDINDFIIMITIRKNNHNNDNN